jgi:riboflavin synthase
MFSGIVEEMGAVRSLDTSLAGARLTVLAEAILADLPAGSSVSVSGACLTVVGTTGRDFTVDLSAETLAVTMLGRLKSGDPVNLERAMRLNERIGGHLVAGHVDAIGTVRDRRPEGGSTLLTIEAPADALRYCVAKGSIAVDGVSMTINAVTDRSFSVMVIPHTAKVTTLGLKKPGDAVNLETDLIGRYVERLLQERGQAPSAPAPVIDRDYLKKRGLL